MSRSPSIASLLSVAFLAGCNPDGACDVPPAGEIPAICTDATKKGCEAIKGNFTAGKKCTEIGYKSCKGGFYKPDSIMCKP